MGALNQRAIKTASDLQVRKKFYKSSINSWKFYKKDLSSTIFPVGTVSSSQTTFKKTFNVSVNHTAVSGAETYVWREGGVPATYDNLVEDFALSLDPFRPGSNTNAIKRVQAYFTNIAHAPSNKKTELAPAGFQSVFLSEAALTNAANRFIRAAPQESKTFEVQGPSFFTGSLTIAENADGNGSGYITVPDGTAAEPTYRFNDDDNVGFFLQSTANLGVAVAGTEEFRLAQNGNFHADGNITAYSSTISSDESLKENIKPLKNNLEKILELKPSSFRWKVKDKEDDVGLIAQEVEKVIPEIVQENISIGNTEEFLDGNTYKTVDYAKLTTYLIGAVQEQQKQIDGLKKKLEEL